MKKRLGMNHGVVYKQHQALSMTLFADFFFMAALVLVLLHIPLILS